MATEPINRKSIRSIVRGAYDIQKLRIQMGNRIVGNFKARLGQSPGDDEDTLDAKGKQILAEIRAVFKKITDGVKSFPKQKDFVGDEVISDFTELCLISQYIGLEKHEMEHFKRLGDVLTSIPIWTEYLFDVKGIGPALAGVIISEIDITKAKYPSSLWAYAGLDVAADGAGRSRRKEHLREVEYTDKDGKPAKRMGITFNPFLKTKLMGVLASSFLRVKDSEYAELYRNYKHRMESHVKWGVHNDKIKDDKGRLITSKGRRHNQAMRFMVKRFLVDLYKAWRKLEGLPIAPEYSEAKLKIVHGAVRYSKTPEGTERATNANSSKDVKRAEAKQPPINAKRTDVA